MTSIAYLGPSGTYTEWAAALWANWLQQELGQACQFNPCRTKSEVLRATSEGKVDFGVVPVENSIEGTVAVVLDTLWELDHLQIQKTLVLPIAHALISYAKDLSRIEEVRSHPQALAQCQIWIEQNLPQAQTLAMSSTTEALQLLPENPTWGAVSSLRAADLYQLPVLAYPINDYPDNCTRFWVVSLDPSPGGAHTSVAFTVHNNVPGALLQPLQIFADRTINLSRIESRPTKRSLGDYLFFVDLEGNLKDAPVREAIEEVSRCTEILKVLGSYDRLPFPKE